jgi:uncharacterized protein YbaR (Trm112 family)
MLLDIKFLAMLACPENRLPLKMAQTELVSELNQLISRGGLRNKKGDTLQSPIEGALLREDSHLFYPVREDIPDLLIEEGVEIPWEQMGGKEKWING